jgi:hypothetical protein
VHVRAMEFVCGERRALRSWNDRSISRSATQRNRENGASIRVDIC